MKFQMNLMDQKGMNFDNDFYTVVGKQRRTESASRVTNTISCLYIN